MHAWLVSLAQSDIGTVLVAPTMYPMGWLGVDAYRPQLFYPALCICFFLWAYVSRLLFCLAGRIVGLYSPNLYHLFPRVPWRLLSKPVLVWMIWWRSLEKDAMPVRFVRLFRGKKARPHDAPRWAPLFEVLHLLYRPGDFFVGRLRVGGFGVYMPVGIRAKKHVMIIADPGAGKTSTLISILSLHRGNAFVIDPKGQMAQVLLARCGSGGPGVVGKGRRALILDPRNQVQGHPSASWNPFDELTIVEQRFGEGAVPGLARAMAEAMVEKDSESDTFFVNSARNFVQALILHVYTTEPEGSRNLVRLWELLYSAPYLEGATEDATATLDALLYGMQHNPAFGGLIEKLSSGIANSVMEGKLGQLLDSAKTQLGWIGDPPIRAILSESGFSLTELKSGDLTLFACAPTSEISGSLRQWFRLLIMMTRHTFEDRRIAKPTHPTLMAVDELPSLGYIDGLETVAPVMRGYGLYFVGITQTLAHLRGVYKENWENFVSTADFCLYLNPTHNDAKTVCEELGAMEPDRDDARGKPDEALITPTKLQQLLNAEQQNILVKRSKRSFVVKTPHYFQELPVYLYARDPDFREAFFRAVSRRILELFIRGAARVKRSDPKGKPISPSRKPTRDTVDPSSSGTRRNEKRTETRPSKPAPVPRPAPERESVPTPLTLVGVGERTLAFNGNAFVGRAVLKALGPDYIYVAEKQFRLERRDDGWYVVSEPSAKHATFVNGEAIDAACRVVEGDEIAVGNRASGNTKMPMRIRLQGDRTLAR